MGNFQFLLGQGHLPKKANKIAQKHGAELINYTEPNGNRRHWFAGPNKGNPFDAQLANDVTVDLRQAGII